MIIKKITNWLFSLNKRKIFKIFQIALVLVFIIPIIIYALSQSFGIDEYKYVKTSEQKLTATNNNRTNVYDHFGLIINWNYGDIEIEYYTGENAQINTQKLFDGVKINSDDPVDPIIVQEYSQNELRRSEKLTAKMDYSNFVIDWDNENFTTKNNPDKMTKKLKILIPEPFKLKFIDINSQISNVSFKGIDTDSISIDIKEGDVNISQINARNIDISLNDGNVVIDTALTSVTNLKVNDADSNITNLTVGKLQYLSKNGDFNFLGKARTVQAKTIYGDMDITSTVSVLDASVDNLFGNAIINFPTVDDFILEKINFVGDITINDFKILKNENAVEYYYDDKSENNYILSTSTGDIVLSEKGQAEEYQSYDKWLDEKRKAEILAKQEQ